LPATIPKVFHQIWLGPKPLPAHFKRWSEQWLALNPGWKLELWTDSHLPDIINRKEFDESEKFAAKSDILRYELILQYGGVYMDTDFEPLRAIDPLLPNVTSFYGDERPDIPCNAILGCAKDDPFYAHVVKALPESFRGPGDIVDKTGPRFLKRSIEAFLGEGRTTQQDEGQQRRAQHKSADGSRQLHAFDWRIFYPYYYTEEHRKNDPFPDAYAKHHWTASWWKTES